MTVPMRAFGLVLGAVLLQSCAEAPPKPVVQKLRVYAADLAGGAKACEVTKVAPVPNKAVAAKMAVGNDGGWCGISVAQDGPKPFAAGLLTARPSHGVVTIHSVGDYTRIDYVPEKGFAGTDLFNVKLLPGSSVVDVAVTVTAGGK
jgi:hypothetical protein